MSESSSPQKRSHSMSTGKWSMICASLMATASVILLLCAVASLFHCGVPAVCSVALFAACLVSAAASVLCYIKLYRRWSSFERQVADVIRGDSVDLISCRYSDELFNDSVIRNIRESLDREYTAVILKNQAEIHALQTQINPHFLYNAIDSIRGEAVSLGADSVSDMLEALARYFRFSISQKADMITLREELDNMDNYIKIQQFRFGNKYSVTKTFSDDPNLMEYSIPKLTLQPIVENALFHGMELCEGPCSLVLRIDVTDARLLISVIDNGVGIEYGRLQKINAMFLKDDERQGDGSHSGIALKNVNDRIRLHFGSHYGLQVFSTLGIGTEVQISLPLVLMKS